MCVGVYRYTKYFIHIVCKVALFSSTFNIISPEIWSQFKFLPFQYKMLYCHLLIIHKKKKIPYINNSYSYSGIKMVVRILKQAEQKKMIRQNTILIKKTVRAARSILFHFIVWIDCCYCFCSSLFWHHFLKLFMRKRMKWVRERASERDDEDTDRQTVRHR